MVYTVYVSNRGHDCGQKTVCCVRSKQFFGMKKIPLTQGKFAIVDDEDFDELMKHKWYTYNQRGYIYAVRHSLDKSGKRIWMHRSIINPNENLFVDHRDGNGLNNTRCNLRVCTKQQNCMNTRLSKRNKSGFKGVYFETNIGKWKAIIVLSGKKKYLGIFDRPETAHAAYIDAAKKYFGDFANCG